MDVVSLSDTQVDLDKVMDRVVEDHAPVVVTRDKAEAVVLVSLADWNAMEETVHLLSSSTNAERLRHAVSQLESDGGTEHSLASP
jgi:antitoxin YefM